MSTATGEPPDRVLAENPPTLVASLGDEAGSIGQWRLIWWKFRRQKVAMAAGILILLFYLVGLFAEFLAPFDPERFRPQYTYAPPQWLHLFDTTPEGGWRWHPHVKGYRIQVDPVALRRSFVIDESRNVPIGFFVAGEPYRLFGLIPMERHLVAPIDPNAPFYLLGSDRIGRDLFSRLIHGTRVSMSIGLVGVGMSLLLGILLGGVSGYYGGRVDMVVQRGIEVISSMPTIPLWMGLAAAIPLAWPPLRVYFIITLIVSLLGWTALAREVRGRFMSLRGEDFVAAAQLDGNSEARLIWRHMLPSLTSHIIATLTLAIPAMIIAETSLSFLGIGLKPPVVSWGVLLQDAQNVRAVASAPWLLIWPGLAVVSSVLAFNFLGDGMRDAADPYAE